MNELLEKFRQLGDDEKLAFFKSAIPELCAIFRQDPQKMMAEMKPFCQEMMRSCGFDPQQMMQMMAGRRPKPSDQ